MEKKEVVKLEFENVSDSVLERVNELREDQTLVLPENYVVGNALKGAWLKLQELKDKDGKPALQVCDKASVANALLDMVIQGLSVSKAQGYFIVYGTKLQFQRSYFGTIAIAKRTGTITEEPVANVIYEGDEFVYEINPEDGRMRVVKHVQKIENINNSKIKGAYAIVKLGNGKTQTTIMTIDQIKKSWAQGQTKGNSPAHQNFPDEMAKKSVIGRACKIAINSSDDAWILDGRLDDEDTDTRLLSRNADIEEGNAVVDLEEGKDVVEISSNTPKPEDKSSTSKNEEKPTEAKKTTKKDPY